MFGKINVMTNFLMGSQVNVDGTWRAITDFAEKSPGKYYTYYIDRNTPDMVLNDAEENGLKIRNINRLLKDEIIIYNGHHYPIDIISQGKYALAVTTLEALPNGSTKIGFDVFNNLVELNKNDAKNILTAADIAEAAIITANW